MAIEDTKQLKTVTTEGQAQELLNEGWMLLGLFDRKDGNDQYAEYHLGKPKAEVEKSNPLRDQFIAAGAFGAPRKD